LGRARSLSQLLRPGLPQSKRLTSCSAVRSWGSDSDSGLISALIPWTRASQSLDHFWNRLPRRRDDRLERLEVVGAHAHYALFQEHFLGRSHSGLTDEVRSRAPP